MQEELFHAHHALEERHWWFRARRHAIRSVGMRLLPPGGRVVDVGCGTGADLASFPASFGRHGLDPSETAIRFARDRHRDLEFSVAAIPESGLEIVATADLVLLCDVLEHIEQDSAFLEGLVGAMRPGAHLLMTVPADPALWSPHDEVYGHHRRYTVATLRAVWDRLPVEERLLAPFNRHLYPLVRAARAVSSRRGRGRGAADGDLTIPWTPVNLVLESVFRREVPPILAALEGPDPPPAGPGVSLFAVLRRRG